MKTPTIREFRTRPRQAREELAKAGEVVLTLNGEPVAVLLAVEDGLEEAVALVERVRAQKAVRDLRAAAKKAGAERLSVGEIDRLVAGTRRARSRRRAAG